MKIFASRLLCLVILTQTFCIFADATQPTEAEADELLTIIHTINHRSQLYQTIVMQLMLTEADYFTGHLKLPTPCPIKMVDVRYSLIGDSWYSVIKENPYPHFPATILGRNICNTNIPREERIRALKIGVCGTFETTNFCFRFNQGKLCDVERISEHGAERYSRHLDQLVGKSSLIDTNGAYQLAMQWLAAIDVDMTALNKLKWTVNQLHYKTHGATNYVTLPLYYVDFGSKHTPVQNNLPASDEPLLSVEILGTTKELQEILIRDSSFSRRPQLLITNILELIHASDLKAKKFEPALKVGTNSSP